MVDRQEMHLMNSGKNFNSNTLTLMEPGGGGSNPLTLAKGFNMNPDQIDHIFFKIEDTNMSTRLTAGDKGFIIGTITKSNNRISISDFPMVHSTKASAIAEATRLLQTGAVSSDRKAVVLKIENYIEVNPSPVIVS